MPTRSEPKPDRQKSSPNRHLGRVAGVVSQTASLRGTGTSNSAGPVDRADHPGLPCAKLVALTNSDSPAGSKASASRSFSAPKAGTDPVAVRYAATGDRSRASRSPW